MVRSGNLHALEDRLIEESKRTSDGPDFNLHCTHQGQSLLVLDHARRADGPMHSMMQLAAARAAMFAGDHTAATPFLDGFDRTPWQQNPGSSREVSDCCHGRARAGWLRRHPDRMEASRRRCPATVGWWGRCLTVPSAIWEGADPGRRRDSYRGQSCHMGRPAATI